MTLSSTARRTALVTLLATGVSLAVATTAFATTDPVPNPPVATPPTAPADVVGTTKARCDAAIDRRLASLATWTTKVNGLAHLTTDQKAALTGELASVSTGLTTVAKPAVDNATDRTTLRAACRAIVTDYRVYLVVHPQVFITAAADGELAAVATLQAFSADLKTKGADTSSVDALLASAGTAASAIPGTVAAITPTAYNADPAGSRATFHSARLSLQTVHLQLHQARLQLKALERSLP